MVQACCVARQREASLVLRPGVQSPKMILTSSKVDTSCQKSHHWHGLLSKGQKKKQIVPVESFPSLLRLPKAVFPALSYWPVPPHLFLDQDSRHNRQKETWEKRRKARPPKVHHHRCRGCRMHTGISACWLTAWGFSLTFEYFF